MASPKFPRHLETCLNPHFIGPILCSEEHSVNIPPLITAQGESSRKRSTTLKTMSISSEDEEDVREASLKVGLLKDPKSQENAHLREVLSPLEVEHYWSTSKFYQGEAEHVKEALRSVKRNLIWFMELIPFREVALT
ncbi:hypothetical protein AMTR_s00076p00146020 [Amborella trichopoda]|uniref:Uncharacterized protein n=1 Tax=Amborella trichopoda TaxID=13333 RepID=W1PAT0_AMBTC|nr:hypothetical protein AMTR_s00076p00146020 [Amborella trichopoda]